MSYEDESRMCASLSIEHDNELSGKAEFFLNGSSFYGNFNEILIRVGCNQFICRAFVN